MDSTVLIETTTSIETQKIRTTTNIIENERSNDTSCENDKLKTKESPTLKVKNLYSGSEDITATGSNQLNKAAYRKLHRSSIQRNRTSSVGALREKYESNASGENPQVNNSTDQNQAVKNDNCRVDNVECIIPDDENLLVAQNNPDGDSDLRNCSISVSNVSRSSSPSKIPTPFAHSPTRKEDLLLKTTSKIEDLQNRLSTKLPPKTVESLRSKYSPASFGYPRLSPDKISTKIFVTTKQGDKPVPPPKKCTNATKSPTKTEKETKIINKSNKPPSPKIDKKTVDCDKAVSPKTTEDDLNNNNTESLKPTKLSKETETLRTQFEEKTVQTEEKKTYTQNTETEELDIKVLETPYHQDIENIDQLELKTKETPDEPVDKQIFEAVYKQEEVLEATSRSCSSEKETEVRKVPLPAPRKKLIEAASDTPPQDSPKNFNQPKEIILLHLNETSVNKTNYNTNSTISLGDYKESIDTLQTVKKDQKVDALQQTGLNTSEISLTRGRPLDFSQKPPVPKKPIIYKNIHKPFYLEEKGYSSVSNNYSRRPLSNIEKRDRREIFPPIPLRPLSHIGSIIPEQRNIRFGKPESIHLIVRRSSSEDSETEVEGYKNFLDEFEVMDSKKKKRSSSFRKLFSGGLFGKDKSGKDDEKRSKGNKKEENIFLDNEQNESNFSRKVVTRHSLPTGRLKNNTSTTPNGTNSPSNATTNYMQTTSPNLLKINGNKKINDGMQPFDDDLQNDKIKNGQNAYRKNVETEFAELHINKYNQIRDNFAQMEPQRFEGYVDMGSSNFNKGRGNYNNINAGSKFIDNSSSTNTNSSGNRSDDTYENCLIAQAEMLQRKESLRNKARNKFFEDNKNCNDPGTDTPPRAHDTCQNVQLVKPKALIPINSERPLPNPYHNGHCPASGQDEEINKSKSEETFSDREVPNKQVMFAQNKQEYINSENPYGTVYDLKSVPAQVVVSKSIPCMPTHSDDRLEPMSPQSVSSLSPRSPLETSKLRLPPNREKVELQPRIKSPIPPTTVSTDKIIATELLKNKSDSLKKDKTDSLKKDKSKEDKFIEDTSSFDRSKDIKSKVAKSKTTLPSHQRLEIEIDYPEGSQGMRSPINLSSPRNQSKEDMRTSSNNSFKHESPKKPPRRIEENSSSSENRSSVYTPINTSGDMSKRSSSALSSPSRNSNVYHQRTDSPSYISRADTHSLPRSGMNSLPRGVSPRSSNSSITQHLEAGEWQRKTRELAASPAIVNHSPNSPNSSYNDREYQENIRRRIMEDQERFAAVYGYVPARRTLSPGSQEIRASTPNNLPASLQPHSPSKAEIRQHVEAYCWKELKKLKDREDHEIYQFHLSNYGYLEDPSVVRRARSMSPSAARGRRSLSLPRDPRMVAHVDYSRSRQQIPIPEDTTMHIPVVSSQSYMNNMAFVRNSPQRRTIETAYNRQQDGTDGTYRPIFKRGSLSFNPELTQAQQINLNKKVSFPNASTQEWPTKNGTTQSPPTRRIDKQDSYIDDEVFLPSTPKGQMVPNPQTYISGDGLYGMSRAEQIYVSRNQMAGDPRQRNSLTRLPQPRYLQQEDLYDSRRRMELEQIYGTRPPVTHEEVRRATSLQNASNPRQREGLYSSNSRVKVSPSQSRDRAGEVRQVASQNMSRTSENHLNKSGSGDNGLERSQSLNRSKISGHNLHMHSSEGSIQRKPSVQPVSASKSAKELYEQRRSAHQLNNSISESNSKVSVVSSPSEVYVPRGRIIESPYGQMGRRMSQDNTTYHYTQVVQTVQESPYGSRSMHVSNPMYVTRHSIAEPIYGHKQVTVSNKVCDMYGKIHDTNQRQVVSPTNYGQVHETGVLYGQLKRNSPNPSHNFRQLPPPPMSASQNFVRGSRLTASANDMYRRMPRQQLPIDLKNARVLTVLPVNEQELLQAPNRPLPPIPGENSKVFMFRRETHRYAPVYDPETSSETSEVQRIMQNGVNTSSLDK